MNCGLGTLNYEQVSMPKLGQLKVDGQLFWALPSRRQTWVGLALLSTGSGTRQQSIVVSQHGQQGVPDTS